MLPENPGGFWEMKMALPASTGLVFNQFNFVKCSNYTRAWAAAQLPFLKGQQGNKNEWWQNVHMGRKTE